ncbi:MAG: DNA mismatch repair protein MutS, partial [Pseudomonadota bacterium]
KAQSFTLFATHYFELTALAAELDACENAHLDATEHAGNLVFLHAVKPGPAHMSYGLQVAALAGVPKTVIRRANEYLKTLEAEQRREGAQAQLDLVVSEPVVNDDLQEAVDELDPDALSPREALDALYRLKDLAGD